MNKTIAFALILLIGSIMASSYSLAQTDTETRTVAAQSATAISPSSVQGIPVGSGSGLGWAGTVNAGKSDSYKIAFSTATVTPNTANNIKQNMVVGVVNLYQGENRVLYKLVENTQTTGVGVKSYLVLPMEASFGSFAEAKSQGIGFLTIKTLPGNADKAKILFYLNKGASLSVGKIYVGDVSRGSTERPTIAVGTQVAAKNVNVQSAGSVDSANVKSTLLQRILTVLKIR